MLGLHKLPVGSAVAKQISKARHPPTSLRVPPSHGRFAPPHAHANATFRVVHTSWPSRSVQLYVLRLFLRAARFLAPVLRGTLRVWQPMSGGQAILRMSPRIPYALRYLAPPSGSRLAYAASMHARLPHGPAALRLPFGAGLQSARAFSTGPAGARLFENMVTSVPFALRAGSCDLDLHGIRAYDFPHVTKTSHRSSSAGADTQRAVPVLPAMSHGFVDASRVATDSYEESPATSDLDMFFPLLLRTVRTPETHVVSRISIHLEPFVPDVALDTSELFMAQAPNANASATMLDYTTSERLRTLGGIYSVHRQRITKLESLLRSYGTWPCALNTSLLLKQHGEAVPATLHVDMKGWTKVQVQQMLLDNFGSSNWLQVEELV